MVSDSLGNAVTYVNVDGGGGQRALGDTEGRFTILLRATSATTLEFRRLGFRAVTVALNAGSDTSLNITMSPVAQRLAAIKVTSEQVRALELHGFYARLADRQKWGGSAQFVTPEEVELRRPNRVTQLFDHLNGITVRRSGSCNIIVKCWVPLGSGNCLMTIYLDGTRLMSELGAVPRPMSSPVPVFIDEIVSPSTVSGIEIYSRPTQAPPQYQILNGTCGVILIWTK
jgi:hypothetical protein